LHERAGNTGVIHLHGSLHAPRCFDCGNLHELDADVSDEPEGGRRIMPPVCKHCGGYVRPGVVWFGELMPQGSLEAAMHATEREGCDVFFSVGASLAIYPAAELPFEAARRRACVIQINPVSTKLDEFATYNFQGKAGIVLPQLVQACWPVSD
jgi:NAD-dependent deacetylase